MNLNANEKAELLKDTIYQLYSKEGHSRSYISKLLGINRTVISNKISEWNFEQAESKRHLTPSNQKFVNKYRNLIKSRLDNDISITKIAEELKVDRQYLQRTIIPNDSILDKARNDYIARLHNNASNHTNEMIELSSRTYKITDLPNEIWKPIFGYDNYMISNMGRVKALSKTYKTWYLLKPTSNVKNNRLYVCLYKNNKRKNIQVANLVAHTFVTGYSTTNNTVNHNDGDVTNNIATNLEWTSQHDNNLHAYRVPKRTSPKPRYKFDKILYKDKYEFKTVRAFAKFIGKSETQARRYLDNPSKYDIKLVNNCND